MANVSVAYKSKAESFEVFGKDVGEVSGALLARSVYFLPQPETRRAVVTFVATKVVVVCEFDAKDRFVRSSVVE